MNRLRKCKNAVICGVIGGLCKWYGISEWKNLIRLVTILNVMFIPLARIPLVIIYIVLAIVLRRED